MTLAVVKVMRVSTLKVPTNVTEKTNEEYIEDHNCKYGNIYQWQD